MGKVCVVCSAAVGGVLMLAAVEWECGQARIGGTSTEHADWLGTSLWNESPEVWWKKLLRVKPGSHINIYSAHLIRIN